MEIEGIFAYNLCVVILSKDALSPVLLLLLAVSHILSILDKSTTIAQHNVSRRYLSK